MFNIKFVVLCAIVLLCQCEGKQLSRCELVRQLRQNGFPENKMRDWVCLVESESSRRTDIIGKPNYDGSRDYGLFQINDRYWCSTTNKPGKDCNVTCKQLVTDNISKAATCAKKIYQRHGFNAWYGWKNKCQGKPLPDISSCKK
ncbi:Lysozyme [Papilio xuthus]|uniref:Lysozyme n=2 Tax=Papilio xuthus TaxID=66420 RepID=A0A194PP71_PAPXU|nr:Lysozyme [Papilio xuthus]